MRRLLPFLLGFALSAFVLPWLFTRRVVRCDGGEGQTK